MPTFEFTSPEGEVYEVEGPEGATEAQAFAMLQTQLGGGQAPAAPAPAPAKEPGIWDQILYGFDSTDTTRDLIQKQREQEFKTPRSIEEIMRTGPREVTGGLGERRTPEEVEAVRAEQLNQKDARLSKDHPDVHGTEYAASGWTNLGAMVRAILSPETLLPGQKIVQATKGAAKVAEAAVTAGGLSGGYAAMTDAVDKGEIDFDTAAKAAALGSVAGGVLAKGGQIANKKLVERKAKKQLGKIVGREQAYREAGLSAEAAQTRALNDLRISAERKQELRGAEYVGADMATARAEAARATKQLDKGVTPGFMDKAIRPAAEVMANISPRLGARLRRADVEEMRLTTELKKQVGLLDDMGREGASARAARKWFKKNKKEGREVMLAAREGSAQNLNRVLAKAPQEVRDVMSNWRANRAALRQLGLENNLKISEFADGALEYFPQVFKSGGSMRNAARKSLGGTKQLDSWLADMKRTYGDLENVPPHIMDARVKDMQSYLAKTVEKTEARPVAPGFTRRRNVEKRYKPEDMDDYLNPVDAMEVYVDSLGKDVARRRMWGLSGEDVHTSIPKIVQQEYDSGTIFAQEMDVIRDFLRARYTGAERAPNTLIGVLKNVGNIQLLGTPKAALTQLGDLGISAAYHGVLPTIRSIFGKDFITAADAGVVNVASELINNRQPLSAALDRLLGRSGFKKIDRLGKTTSINASIRKFNGWVKDDKKTKKLFERFENAFTNDEMAEAIEVFKNPSREKIINSPAAMSMVVHDLLEIQPAAMSELPFYYQNNPNARIMYSLKTFTLKQFDLMHKNIWDAWRRGDKADAIAFAIKYGTIVSAVTGSTNFAKQLITGGYKDQSPEVDEVVTEGIWSMIGGILGPFGNKYNLERWNSRDFFQRMWASLTMPPAVSVAENMRTNIANSNDAGPEDVIKNLPYFGPIVKGWVD